MWPSSIQMIIIIQKRWTTKSSYYAYLIHPLSLRLLAKIINNTLLKLLLYNLKIKNNLHLLIQHQLLLLATELLQHQWYTIIITKCTIIIQLRTLAIITTLAFKALNLIAIKVGILSLINLLVKGIIILTASNRKE